MNSGGGGAAVRAEEWYRVLFEQASEPIYLVDAATRRFVDANEAALRLLGLTRDELLSMSAEDISGPADLRTLAQDHAHLERAGSVRLAGRHNRRKDGTLVPVDLSIRHLRIGERTFHLILALDLTERVKAEQSLTLHKEIIEKSNDGIAVIDAEGRYLQQNAAHARMLGYSDEDLLGRTPAVHLVRPAFETIVRDLVRTGAYCGEVVSRTKDGTLKDIELSAFAMRNERGEPTCFVGIKRDITERTRAREQLRVTAENLRSLVDSMFEGLIITEGPVVKDVNKVTTTMLGYTRDEMIGRPALDFVAPESRETVARMMSSGCEEPYEGIGVRKDGSRIIFEICGRRYVHNGRPARVTTVRDITARKRAEEALRRAMRETRLAYARLKRMQEQLIRSERLAGAGVLLSGVAHEINNPINVILGNLKLMKARCRKLSGALRGRTARARMAELVRPVPGMLADALSAAEAARRVILEFRAFARDPRTAEETDLNACVREALAALRRELARVTVRREFGDLPPVRCVAAQLRHALVNLIKNAVEATGGRGTLTVRTARRGRRVEVSITDTGRGIPRDQVKRVFEPFFTTKAEGRGLGLGLPISATIVHNHGGRLTLSSRRGRGTTATILLPASRRP